MESLGWWFQAEEREEREEREDGESLCPFATWTMSRRHRSRSMQLLHVLRPRVQCWWRNSDGAIGLVP